MRMNAEFKFDYCGAGVDSYTSDAAAAADADQCGKWVLCTNQQHRHYSIVLVCVEFVFVPFIPDVGSPANRLDQFLLYSLGKENLWILRRLRNV